MGRNSRKLGVGVVHRINSVQAVAEGYALILTWEDGTTWVKDMRPLIETRSLFAPLIKKDFFATVQIIDGGRAIAWADEIDYCADALWLEANQDSPPQHQPPTTVAAE